MESVFARDVTALGQAARLRAELRHGWDPVFRKLSGIYGRLTGCAAFGEPMAEISLTQ